MTNNPTSPREELARIIDPSAWQAYDMAVAPHRENRGANGDEAWLYWITWRLGFRTETEVRTWWFSKMTDGACPSSTHRWRCQTALAKADEWLSRPPVKTALDWEEIADERGKVAADLGARLVLARMAISNAVDTLANRGRFGSPDDALAGLKGALDALKSGDPVKAASPEGEAETLEEAKQDCWSQLCEVDDRNSPEEYPDMCLITQEELFAFMDAAAEASTPPASERAEMVASPELKDTER